MSREAGEGGRLVLYGRVRDAGGAGVPGALVVVFAPAGEEERPLGHGYCDRDGWYAVGVPRPAAGCRHRYIIRTAGGIGPAEEYPGAGMSWRGEAGWPRRRAIQIESRVINHSLLGFTARDGVRVVSLEAIPETVCVDCEENGGFNLRLVSVSGRGYIKCGDERGEGSFCLTVCRFRDTAGEDLLRFKICPDDPLTGLGLDTGGLPAGLE